LKWWLFGGRFRYGDTGQWHDVRWWRFGEVI
jgi:hypothetical protein